MSVPLIAGQKSADVQLSIHPIVLLSISDHVARHSLRAAAEPALPLAGLLMGTQDGCKVSVSRAFDLAVRLGPAAECLVDSEVLGFCDQLQSHTRVVGYYTILPRSGPDHRVLPLHESLARHFHDRDLLLLAFHPDHDLGSSSSSTLPITFYESRLLPGAAAGSESADGDKILSGTDEAAAGAVMPRQFSELAQYTVVTDDAEMIGMDFVAAGGGNAKAIVRDGPTTATAAETTASTPAASKDAEKSKGKQKASDSGLPQPTELQLMRDEEDTIAALRTKANAVRMLQARVDLLAAYLSALSGPCSGAVPAVAPDHSILRQILAAVVRLGLIEPSDSAAFAAELAAEETAAAAIDLINVAVQAACQSHVANRLYAVADGSPASAAAGMPRLKKLVAAASSAAEARAGPGGSGGGGGSAGMLIMPDQRRSSADLRP
ncbi:hypothetical protein BROUX41_001298 [Berkeleyomyces rouxiae]|uniref:uncharacterized protein n=1 Tax=Berkeleyomyces rouxiae TaxID=2035830 RepID=UPI003B762474